MKERNKYLVKNTLLFGISSFGTKFLSVFLVPLYTNVLSTSEYGISDLITTTGTLLIFILSINISDAVLRYAIERKGADRHNILSFGIKVLSIGSLILLFILLIVSAFKIIEWNIFYYIFLFLYFFVLTLYQILSNYLRADDKVKDLAVAGIISSLVIIFCNILFLLVIKNGVYGYLISMILGPCIACIYSLIRIRIPIIELLKNGCDQQTKKEMIAYSIPLIFNNIALWINAYLDRYFITAMCGVDQNGIYSVASKIPTILSICYTVFTQAWTLSAIKEFDKNDKEGFFSQAYNIYGALMVFVCSLIILFNIPLAKILYSKDFYVAWNYSSVLLISVMFNAFTAFQGSIFSAIKQTKIIAYTTVISAVVNIFLNIILIKQFGVLGAAIATVAAYVTMWGLRFMVLRKYIILRVNLVRDVIAYCLLSLQVVFEHINGHFYAGQLMIVILLTLVYKNYIKSICNTFIGYINSRRK